MTTKKRMPRLPPRKTITDEDLLIIAQTNAAKAAQQEVKNKITNWITNNKSFDVSPYLKIWEKLRDKYRNQFLDLVVKTMSIADGANNANESITYGLKMENSGMRVDQIFQILEKTFRIQTTAMLISDSTVLSKFQKEAIINRAIAKEFPTHDNVSKSADNKPVQLNLPIQQERYKAPERKEPRPFIRRESKINNKLTDFNEV